MKKIAVLLFFLLPSLAFADWESDLIERLKEEGYSKKEIEIFVERKRQQKNMAEKEIVEAEKAVVDSEEEKIIPKEEKENSVPTSSSSRSSKDQWLNSQLKELKQLLEENEWPEREISKRLYEQKSVLQRCFGKDESSVQVEIRKLQQKLSVDYAKKALREKEVEDVCLTEVHNAYKEYVNIHEEGRLKKINEIYKTIEKKMKDARKQIMSTAKANVLLELKSLWLEDDLDRRMTRPKEEKLRSIFEVMSVYISKKAYEDKLKKITSLKIFNAKEKKIVLNSLKNEIPIK